MSPEEYRELVHFIGQRFDAVDERFDGLEGRVTKNAVSIEALRDELRTVAQGVAMNGGRLDRIEPRLESVERIVASYGGMLVGIAEKVDSIDERIEGVESKLDVEESI